MPTEACIASIKNHYNSLTRTERSIADYVLVNSGQMTEMNVAQLAQASGAAGSAVIRFCKSVGYSGFSQFRLALAKELAARPASFLPLICERFQAWCSPFHTGQTLRCRLFAPQIFSALLAPADDSPDAGHVPRRAEGQSESLGGILFCGYLFASCPFSPPDMPAADASPASWG